MKADYRVILDACVLANFGVCDLLLRLAPHDVILGRDVPTLQDATECVSPIKTEVLWACPNKQTL